MTARWVIAATAAIFALTGSYRTAKAQAGPVFEVSPASPASRGFWSTQRQTPQMLSFVGALLPDMIAFAYELPVDPGEGRPQWISSSRHDVAVTTAVPTSLPEQRRLLQKLLEERFSLVTRRISYRIPAYFLVQGPKVNLTPSRVQDPDAVGVPQAACRTTPQTSSTCIARMSMSDLVRRISVDMQVAVLDKTGILGFFDIELSKLTCPGRGCVQDYTPVLNRLGLKLDLHRDAPMESLVIDKIEKPSQN